MARKRSAQIDQEIREALARIPRKPGLKTREQLDAEIDTVLAGGLPAERYEVAQALGFRYPKQAPPKTMTLTGTNLFALTQLVIEHGPTFPNRLAAVDVPHIKRTLALGLIAPMNGSFQLTDTGRALVVREIEQNLEREHRHPPRVSALVKPELRDAVQERGSRSTRRRSTSSSAPSPGCGKQKHATSGA